MQNLWLIPALPFIGFLINGIFGRKLPKAVINVDRGTERCTLVRLGDEGFSDGRRPCRDACQRALFHLDQERRIPGWLGFCGRQADHDHADDRHRHRLSDSHLLHRLHGARRRLLPLLRLPESVHVLHAQPGAGGELSDPVRGLGRRRSVQLSADRLLFREEERDDRRQQGVHCEPHRRLWILAGDVPDRRSTSAP